MARLAPDTASRCVSPAARKSASTSAVSRLVSPTVEPGKQPGRGRRQHAGGAPAARRAARRPRTATTAARVDHTRRAADPQHGHGEVAPAGRGEQPLGGGGLAGQQPVPPLGRRDQQHPAAGHPAPAADLGLPDRAAISTCVAPPACAAVAGGPDRVRVVAQHGPAPWPPRRARPRARSGCRSTSSACAVITSPAASAQPAAASDRTIGQPGAQRASGEHGGRRGQPDRHDRPEATIRRAARRAQSGQGRPERAGDRAGGVGSPEVGRPRSSSGSEPRVPGHIRPSPARAAARTGVRRCPRSRAAARPGRTARCGCASRGCAGR